MTREEMMAIVRTFDITEGHACEHCPLAEECELHELWWGCDVWESGMGEDLQTPKQNKKFLKRYCNQHLNVVSLNHQRKGDNKMKLP